MPIGLYRDVHISRAVIIALRMRGIDVLASYDDRARTLTDAKPLDRATLLGRLLYSQDDDLLKEARSRIEAGIPFTGVVYSHQLHSPIGRCIDDLEIIAKILEPEDLISRIEFIPF